MQKLLIVLTIIIAVALMAWVPSKLIEPTAIEIEVTRLVIVTATPAPTLEMPPPLMLYGDAPEVYYCPHGCLYGFHNPDGSCLTPHVHTICLIHGTCYQD